MFQRFFAISLWMLGGVALALSHSAQLLYESLSYPHSIHWHELSLKEVQSTQGRQEFNRLIRAYAYVALYRLPEQHYLLLLSANHPIPWPARSYWSSFLGDQTWLRGLPIYSGQLNFEYKVPMHLLYPQLASALWSAVPIPHESTQEDWQRLNLYVSLENWPRIQKISTDLLNEAWPHLNLSERRYLLALAMIAYLHADSPRSALLLWDRFAKVLYGDDEPPLDVFLLRRFAVSQMGAF